MLRRELPARAGANAANCERPCGTVSDVERGDDLGIAELRDAHAGVL